MRAKFHPIALSALLAVISQLLPSAEGSKPNIVFILMDNLGYGEVGCYGGGITRGAPTPRIDSSRLRARA